MLIISNYDKIGNAKKNVTHIPKLRAAQHLFVFDIRYYLKISLTYSKLLK